MNAEQIKNLAQHFTARVEAASDALGKVRLARYADEVCIMLPRSAAEFPAFVRWCEGMQSCMQHWASLADVRAQNDPLVLQNAVRAVSALADEAKRVLALYAAEAGRAA